jgi:FixJ family two-component response regulator
MPVLDGLAVQARLAREGRAVPVIFISATEQGEQRRLALSAGAVAFLQKPFDGQTLLDTIALAMGRAKQKP